MDQSINGLAEKELTVKVKSLILAVGFFFHSLQAFAAEIDKSFESRIIAACIKSVEETGKKIPNHKEVCKCIGATHFVSAIREVHQAEAEEHIKWTTDFYETSDMKLLQKMVDKNPKWSSFDDQVVDDCMQSANQGSKK